MAKHMSQLIEQIRMKEKELVAARKAEEKAARELEEAAKELTAAVLARSDGTEIPKQTAPRSAKATYRRGFLTANKRRLATANHLLKVGLTPSQVARKIGCSSSSIYYAIEKGILKQPSVAKSSPIGPPTPLPSPNKRSTRRYERKKNVFFTPEKIAEAKKMRAEGKGPTEIGRAIGCGEATVRYRIRMGDI